MSSAFHKSACPQKQELHWHRAVFWLSVGFLTIIVLIGFDAVFDFAGYLLGQARRTENIREAALKIAVIFLLWAFSAYKIYKIVSRLSYLENFVHLCSWCRKIEVEEKWLTLEELFSSRKGSTVTHGLCPDCLKKMRGGIPSPTEENNEAAPRAN